MTNIPRDLEDAFVLYLRSCADIGQGGLSRFVSEQGLGAELEIRAGHADDGEHPSRGMILCACVQDSVQQEVIGINAWRATIEVSLVYPYDGHSNDPSAVASFDYIAAEISGALTQDGALEKLNACANGIYIHGPREGITMQSSIDKSRILTWPISLMCSSTQKRPTDL